MKHDESETSSPSILYQRARHEWDERMGSVIKQAHTWKIVALAALSVTFISVMGVVYIGSQSKIEPYAIAIQDNNALPVGRMSQLPKGQLNGLHVKELTTFIEGMRSVLVDVEAQKKRITQAYAMLVPNTPAYEDAQRFFKNNDVFTRAQSELVTVEVMTILPLTDNTFQAEWKETISARQGNVLPYYKKYKATMNTFTVPPKNEKSLYANPLGFYVRTFNVVEIQ